MIVLMLLATVTLVALAAARKTGSPRAFFPVWALGVALLLAAYSWENLLYSFQVSFVGVLPFAVGAFVALAWSEAGTISLAVAAICAAGAAFSLASGVIVAPLLIAFAWWVRRPRWHFIALSAVAGALVTAYLVGYETPGHHSDPASTIRQPFATLDYTAAYLGGPFTWNAEKDRVPLARFFGYVGLVAWLGSAAHAVVRKRRDAPSSVLPFVMTFIVGTAILTALGRLRFHELQAFESRYGSSVFVFWSALVAHATRLAERPVLRVVVGFVACVLALSVARAQEFEEKIARGRLEPLRPVETALLAGALEVSTINRITPDPRLVEEALPELRKRRLSIFRSGWSQWIGKPIERLVEQWDEQACTGYLDRARPVPAYRAPAFRLEGWAYSLRDQAAAKWVILVDDRDLVVGFARTGYPRPDVSGQLGDVKDPLVGFVGHVGALGSDQVEVRAAVLLDGRVACWLHPELTLREADAVGLVKW
jgi:hypothetical protein